MNIYAELSLIILVAAAVGGLMRLLKQPLIIGHILTGILVGPYILGIFVHKETIDTLSQMGITILLFIVGLSLSPKIIHEAGKTALIAGLSQISFTTLVGYFFSKLLGFSTISSLYIAIALTFSSTIIVLKLLSDKKEIEKLHGRISVGILLVQDVVASVILILVSTFSHGGSPLYSALEVGAKGIALTIALVLISTKVLPKMSTSFAKSQEYLFLFSIAWGFGMSNLFKLIGFSVEIGALIAGVTLSVSPYAQEISAKLKPLRDFFIVLFFISLGSNLVLSSLGVLIFPAIVLSFFVLIGNPLIVIMITGAMGYNRKTAFMAGINIAQVSEFSLILLMLGVRLGQIPHEVLSLVTIVGIITIAVSTYLIMYAEQIYPYIAEYLVIFEQKKIITEIDYFGVYDVVLFGCNRVGYDFIHDFKKLGRGFLAVDFDPEIIALLQKDNINCKYGDAEDGEFLEELGLENSKIVISTIPEFETNLYLTTKIRKVSDKTIIIVISYNIDEAIKLYDKGATYVILPHFIGGQFAAELAHRSGFDITNLEHDRKHHIKYLKERKALGHSHPHWAHQ